MDGRRFNGARARALRRSTGTRMIRLAETLPCSYGHVRMTESGDRDISDELAAVWAAALTRLLGYPVTADDLSDPADTPAVVA